jgi:RNA polymerase sigma-70 factor (ECF subfamily)
MDPEITTQELVERAQAGDRVALAALTSKHHDDVDHYVRLRIGEHLREMVPIEDAVQETFARACEAIKGFRWRNDGSFLRWLKGIAEHVILRIAQDRRRDRILYVDHESAPADTTSPSRTLRRHERFDRLQEALESLSPEHRQVIVLARLKGLRMKEIAERMNRTPNAVALLLARALAKLREGFGDTDSLHLPWASIEDPELNDDDRDASRNT